MVQEAARLHQFCSDTTGFRRGMQPLGHHLGVQNWLLMIESHNSQSLAVALF